MIDEIIAMRNNQKYINDCCSQLENTIDAIITERIDEFRSGFSINIGIYRYISPRDFNLVCEKYQDFTFYDFQYSGENNSYLTCVRLKLKREYYVQKKYNYIH